jgi:SAM-dependent methyltransferase
MVCGTVSQRWGEKQGYLLFMCRNCGVVFAPSPVRAEIDELYGRYHDHASFFTPPTAAATLERLVRWAERFRRTGRWLDIGYGEGGLLTIATRYGWSGYGIEVSRRALEYGRQQGWSVTADPATDERFVTSAFDVVTMIECLEHQATPLEFLHQAAQWLTPHGVLYLTTPNMRSLNGRVLGIDWSIVCPPEHLVLWTTSALRRVVPSAGLRILSVRAEGCNPREMIARMRVGNYDKPPVNRNRSGIALSEALSRTRIRRMLKAGINGLLNAFGLGDTLKVSAQRVV